MNDVQIICESTAFEAIFENYFNVENVVTLEI